MNESGPRDIRARLAIAGLLVLLAFSLAAAWGRKPPKEEEVKVTLRPLSASEVMDVLHKFPEMVPSYFAAQKNDTGFLKDLFPFSEVTSASLERAFPAARFYEGLNFGRLPSSPYLMAIAGGKRYMMPYHFNQLLFDTGRRVDDRNTMALAKAFVVLTVEDSVTFLDAVRTMQVINTVRYDAELNVVINGLQEEWYFSSHIRTGQFDLVYRKGAKGLIKEYDVNIVESLPKR